MEKERRVRPYEIDKNVMMLDMAVSDLLKELTPKANFYHMDIPIEASTMFQSKNKGNLEAFIPQTVKYLSANFDFLSYPEKILVCIGWESLWGHGKPPLKVALFEENTIYHYTTQKINCPQYSDLGIDTLLILKAIDTDSF